MQCEMHKINTYPYIILLLIRHMWSAILYVIAHSLIIQGCAALRLKTLQLQGLDKYQQVDNNRNNGKWRESLNHLKPVPEETLLGIYSFVPDVTLWEGQRAC